MKCRNLTIALAALLVAGALPAQAADSGRATRHDVAPRLSEMAQQVAPTGLSSEVNPIRPPENLASRPSVAQAPDAARQDDATPTPGAAPTPAPIITWEGVSDDDNALCAGGRIVPPDTEGDVGETYYVQWNNLCLEIYDKTTGASVFGPVAGNSLWSGFGGPCQTNNDGDPIVLFDHLAGRWFFSQFSINEGIQCVAISQGSDPQGPYDRWEFTVSPGQNNDYPKFGLMPESYVLTLRDFPSGTPPFASAVLFDRKAMLAGDANPRFVKDGLTCTVDCVDGWQPPHLEGPPPPAGTPVVLTKVWDDDFSGPVTGCDGVRLWQYDVDWSVDPPTENFASIGTACGANFDSDMCGFFNRNCIPQASATQLLDPIDELQMYRAQYRHWPTHDSLVLVSTVDATSTDVAGQRWIEMRNSGGGWSIHQESTYAPADGEERWMGSAAMDGSGGIALGYSASSTANDPSIRYTSREAGDALGTMPGGEVVMQAGGGAQTGANRWGDYSSMSVDPVDDCTFYYTQEYYQTTGSFDFNSKIGSFKLASCNAATCGNGFCQPGEDCNTCGADCEITTDGGGGTPGDCGNGVCEPSFGEDCLSCAIDCRGKQNGKPSNRYCCGDGAGENPIVCSDGDGSICNQGGFTCGTFSGGGGGTVCCGDGFCDEANGECGVCERDCSGDPACSDNGGGGCTPTHAKEKGPRCSDGLDNDCDGLIDGADPDC